MKAFLDNQDKFLSELEETLGFDSVVKQYGLPEKSLNKLGFVIPEMPNIYLQNFETELCKLPEFEYSLLPRWKVADIPVMVVVGFLGALISLGLHDWFDELHKNWGMSPNADGGHGGEIIDKVRGGKHRLKYGHDILNPFEIDWDNYFPEGVEASLLKKVCAWLRHLFQDSFSKEGIPLPGSSYFRDIITNFNLGELGKYNTYKTFFTVKARDITGTAFVAGAMSLYIFGTERGEKNKLFNYRYTSLTLGALIINICCGLSVSLMTGSNAKVTFNHSAVIAMIPYIITLFKVNKRLNEQLNKRNETIAANQITLDKNRSILDTTLQELQEHEKQMEKFILEAEKVIALSSETLSSCIDECNILINNQSEWLDELEAELSLYKGA